MLNLLCSFFAQAKRLSVAPHKHGQQELDSGAFSAAKRGNAASHPRSKLSLRCRKLVKLVSRARIDALWKEADTACATVAALGVYATRAAEEERAVEVRSARVLGADAHKAHF